MATGVTKVTKAGLEKLKAELEYMKGPKRQEVAQKIREAISFGDLSENSEYDAAKNEQAQLENDISMLEMQLKNVEIIEEPTGTDVVNLGVTVKIYDEDMEEEEEYKIVGSREADQMNNLISDESPIGKALIGKKVGDEVSVEAPFGSYNVKILEIKL